MIVLLEKRRVLDMSEEAKLLIDQIERMNNFYMWSVGIFITLIISFVGFFSFVQFKLSEKQKKKILKETEDIININVSELSNKIDLKAELSAIDVSYNYSRNITLSALDESVDYVRPSLSINIFFKTIFNIDTFVLKHQNKEMLEGEIIENLTTIINNSLFLVVRLIDAAEKNATKLDEFKQISKDINEYKQYIYRLYYNELFKSDESMKNAVTVLEKYTLQVEEKIKTIDSQLTQTPN